MNRKQTLAILATPLLLSGCNGAFWGNFIVLAITVGIFVGTLSLGRSSTDAARSADSSTQSRG